MYKFVTNHVIFLMIYNERGGSREGYDRYKGKIGVFIALA